jgi:hypothetical protein
MYEEVVIHDLAPDSSEFPNIRGNFLFFFISVSIVHLFIADTGRTINWLGVATSFISSSVNASR